MEAGQRSVGVGLVVVTSASDEAWLAACRAAQADVAQVFSALGRPVPAEVQSDELQDVRERLRSLPFVESELAERLVQELEAARAEHSNRMPSEQAERSTP